MQPNFHTNLLPENGGLDMMIRLDWQILSRELFEKSKHHQIIAQNALLKHTCCQLKNILQVSSDHDQDGPPRSLISGERSDTISQTDTRVSTGNQTKMKHWNSKWWAHNSLTLPWISNKHCRACGRGCNIEGKDLVSAFLWAILQTTIQRCRKDK